MTLFEKIYFTCLILNIIFFILGQCGVFDDLINIIDLEWLGYLLGSQVSLTVGYLIVKLILWIWGINIDLFPCVKIISN